MSFLHGATCVALDGRALLIEGPSGSGKSTLALALIDRGGMLIGDDGVTLERRGDDLIASYSSKGPTLIDHVVKPDIVAPGNRVISLVASRSLIAGS